MSAIFGIFNRDRRPVSRPALERMIESLAHRGSDSTGIWQAATIGLGHRLLRNTPESFHERLPFALPDAELAITADARIDNRAELIATLDLRHRPAGELPDSALILAAYQRWGERCPEHLLGDFAFAIWDGRRQLLFCARDQLGAKPLYYYCSEQLFAFAVEIKALLCLPEVPRRLNEARLADHLAGIHEDVTETLYRDILRLPAAHTITISREQVQIRRYWDLDATSELRLGSDAAYAEAFREVFAEAVRCRLRSAFPVGSMLSGGLDSSSIACMARDQLAGAGQPPLHSFSAIWPSLSDIAPKSDERRYVDAVVAIGRIEPHYVEADRLSPLADLDRVIWHEDELHLGFNLYMDWALFHAAQQHGVRVLMSGHDGDTIVSYGYEHFAQLTRRGRWNTLVKEAGALARVNASYSRQTIIWQFGILPVIPQPVRMAWRGLCPSAAPDIGMPVILDPAFARRSGVSQRLKEQQDDFHGYTWSIKDEHRQAIMSSLNVHAMETFDKAAAAFQVEPCYPFYDRRMVELCLALPAGQKMHQGWSRSILRRAMQGILPSEVQWRKGKSDISANFQRGLFDDDRATLDRVILRDPAYIEPYFDLAALRRAYQRCLDAPMRYNEETLSLFLAVVTDRWLRTAQVSA